MNEIVNKFLLKGVKIMQEMHLKQPDLLIVVVVHLLKIKKEFKILFKQEIQIIFIGMIWIKLVFSMIWFMVDINIWLKEQSQVKF